MKFTRLLLLLMLFWIAACSAHGNQPDASPSQVVSPKPSVTLPSPTVSPSLTPSPTPTPTRTATAIPPTITPTAPQLSLFESKELRPGVSPRPYIDDPCTYLENRWGQGKSEPGTIVVPIMFHSVVKPGREVTDPANISTAYFEYFMGRAEELGFTTITTEELIGFLYENQKIPEKSMLLILDDRRPGVTELFMPYLDENDWTLTLAWPTTDATGATLWAQMEGLAETGRLDVQSHGHDHIYIQDYTTLEEVEEEIYKPIDVIETHFGTTPRALIWPGGNFTESALDIAKVAGFKVGFTVFSRGPLMFNWIPQGEEEFAMSLPLMVLPRYWSKDGDIALQQALAVGEAARLEAEALKAEEMQYLDRYCQNAQGE